MAMKWIVLYCIYIGQFCTFPGNIYWQDNHWHFSAFRMYAHSYHQCFRLQRTTFSQRMNLKSNSYMFSINCVHSYHTVCLTLWVKVISDHWSRQVFGIFFFAFLSSQEWSLFGLKGDLWSLFGPVCRTLILEIPFAPDANAKTYKIKLQLQNLSNALKISF